MGKRRVSAIDAASEGPTPFALRVIAMKRSGIGLAVLSGVLVALGLARGGDSPPFKMTAEEAKLLDLTNQERKKKELPPLRTSPRLFQIARAHSANMAKQEKMEHILDGKTPFDRMKEAGYPFVKGAENIAACKPAITMAQIVEAWMESKQHKENILNTEFTEIGLGLARDKDGQIYYTQVFARPQSKD